MVEIKKSLAVAFIGPIAAEGEPAAGGFESANRRTINLLNVHGVRVLELGYPVARGPIWIKTAIYLFGFVRIASALVRQTNAFRVVHITPLRRQFVLAELAICLLSRFLKKKILVDLRAGDLISSYYRLGFFHRKCLAAMIASANVIGAEAVCYLPFLVETMMADRVFYLPNFTYVPPQYNERRFDDLSRGINVVMLGRIAPEKGTGLGIEIIRVCSADVPVRLTIIGDTRSEYGTVLKNKSKDLPVVFTGGLNASEVQDRLSDQHIFLFPTRHSAEGHSNALTEAMAAGLVPIASDNGFNSEVVGDCGFIVSADATADHYASILLDAIRSPGLLRELSLRARTRAERLFSDARVFPVLLDQYRALTTS